MNIATAELYALQQENAELKTRLAASRVMREALEQSLLWIERLLKNQFLDPAQKVYLLALRLLDGKPDQRKDADGYLQTTHQWIEKHSGIPNATQARVQQQLKEAGAVQVRHTYDPVKVQTHASFKLSKDFLRNPEQQQNAPGKPKRGGKRPRCRECHSDNVIIKQRVDILQTTTCRECGTVFAEQLPSSSRVVFDALVDTLQNVQPTEV